LGSKFCFRTTCLLTLAALFCAGLYGADQVQAVFEKAASALAARDYISAERGFQAVLKAQPGNVGALGNLGVVYSRTHRYSQAIEVYRRALRIAPGDKGLETNLGLAYIKQEQHASALPIFEKLADEPANLQARELLATCRLAVGQLESALAVLEPLRASDPKNTGVLYMLGVAFAKLKRVDEAREAFTQMMESVSPAQANFLMGKASYETGRFEEAVDFFQKTLGSEPGFEGAHRELGKALISLRDNDRAVKELRQAAPEDAEALYFLGGLLAQARRVEAIPILTRALELSPDAWGPLYYLGRIHLAQGHVQQALLFLQRAAKLKPDEPAIQYQLGRALQKGGREAEARTAFARVEQLKAHSLKSEMDVLSPGKDR
jgi:tetratricopeptide (TPR) repeat protein